MKALRDCRCKGCGRIIICPYCEQFKNEPDLSIVSNAEGNIFFCSKECRDAYVNKTKITNGVK